MLIVTALYLGIVYLIFFKWKILPFNKLAQGIVVPASTMKATR